MTDVDLVSIASLERRNHLVGCVRDGDEAGYEPGGSDESVAQREGHASLERVHDDEVSRKYAEKYCYMVRGGRQ